MCCALELWSLLEKMAHQLLFIRENLKFCFLAGVSMTLVTVPLVFGKHVYTETPAILDTLFEKFELISVLAPVQPVTSKRMIYISSSEVAYFYFNWFTLF